MASQIEEIKGRIDIVELVGSYIRLQKGGANFKARCPFHNERTPSFNVSPARQIWHCFGCGKGGDAFTFVQEIEGMEFGEALKMLAERAGVDLRHEDFKEKGERARMYALMEEATKFFETELLNYGRPTSIVRLSTSDVSPLEYLRSRGLTDETIREFRLGYAPGEWRALSDHLNKKGFLRDEIVKAGLAVSHQVSGSKFNDSYYDRFRGRIIFPIFDYSGRVVAFGGRILAVPTPGEVGTPTENVGALTSHKATEGAAKYINSPETSLYQKSKTLYGLNKAKSEILKSGECVLVEGYMDMIMSWQAGVKNVVASSGTALTDDQLKILRRLADKLIAAFDMDLAGEGAAKRGIDLAQKYEFDVRVARLERFKDPADAAAQDPKSWKESVEKALHIARFYIDSALAKYSPETSEAKREFQKSVLPVVASLQELERAHWVREISQILRVKEEAVWEALQKAIRSSDLANNLVIRPGARSADQAEARSDDRAKTRKELLETRILSITANFPELAGKLEPEVAGILPKANTAAFFAELLIDGLAEAEAELTSCQREWKKEFLRERMSKISAEVAEAEKAKSASLPGLLTEFKNISAELAKLRD